MQVREKQEPVSEHQIRLLEDELKIKLPTDYRDFLLEVDSFDEFISILERFE